MHLTFKLYLQWLWYIVNFKSLVKGLSRHSSDFYLLLFLVHPREASCVRVLIPAVSELVKCWGGSFNSTASQTDRARTSPVTQPQSRRKSEGRTNSDGQSEGQEKCESKQREVVSCGGRLGGWLKMRFVYKELHVDIIAWENTTEGELE